MLYKHCLLFIIVLTISLFAQQKVSEKEHFRRAGYNVKHYNIAQQLNLDLKNYHRYYENRKNRRIQGPVFTSIGCSLLTGGIIYYSNVSKRGTEESTIEASRLDIFGYFSSSVLIAGGSTLTSIGLIKFGQSFWRKVYRKDGTELSFDLHPVFNPLQRDIGLQLSLNF